MICLNCGTETTSYLCESCRTEEILIKIYEDIIAKPDNCDNSYVKEYAEKLDNPYMVRDCIPEILNLFTGDIAEYFWCRYYRISKNPEYENYALSYIAKNQRNEKNTQVVINDLLEYYGVSDYFKPDEWCEYIRTTDGLYCELYYNAAQHYARVGEYDYADELIAKALKYCKESDENVLNTTSDKMEEKLTKCSSTIQKYRTKPYWPSTEDKRRIIASIYDKKSIKYTGRIAQKPQKVSEDEFEPIKECYEETVNDYCAFWCAEANNFANVKSIYQIAAIKVRDNIIVDEFQSYVRPWDGKIGKQNASKKAGVSLEQIETAKDVDEVMTMFFAFVGDDVLISTDALGKQAALMSRAARYSGMKEIKNEFLELLDLAANVSEKFDNENNTREYLIEYFNISEGSDAIGKAKNNIKIYNELKKYGK